MFYIEESLFYEESRIAVALDVVIKSEFSGHISGFCSYKKIKYITQINNPALTELLLLNNTFILLLVRLLMVLF